MSKHDTQYYEGERALSQMNMNRYGLNPFAADILIHSYKQNVAPYPANIMYEVTVEGVKSIVEIYMATPGFLGKAQPIAQGGLDKFGLKLFARSYYENLRPKHFSCVYHGVELHVRTPGVDEDNHKNVARNVFNPTV